MNLLENLNEIFPTKVGRVFDNINAGGCGIFAFLLARELTNIGVSCEIFWLGSGQPSEEDILEVETLRQLNEKGMHCDHIFVKCGGRYIDCKGAHESFEEAGWYNSGQATISNYKSIEHIITRTEGWNTWFDRGQIPKIEKAVKELISELADKTL